MKKQIDSMKWLALATNTNSSVHSSMNATQYIFKNTNEFAATDGHRLHIVKADVSDKYYVSNDHNLPAINDYPEYNIVTKADVSLRISLSPTATYNLTHHLRAVIKLVQAYKLINKNNKVINGLMTITMLDGLIRLTLTSKLDDSHDIEFKSFKVAEYKLIHEAAASFSYRINPPYLLDALLGMSQCEISFNEDLNPVHVTDEGHHAYIAQVNPTR